MYRSLCMYLLFLFAALVLGGDPNIADANSAKERPARLLREDRVDLVVDHMGMQQGVRSKPQNQQDVATIIAEGRASEAGYVPLNIVVKHHHQQPRPDESSQDVSNSKQRILEVDHGSHAEGKSNQNAFSLFAQVASSHRGEKSMPQDEPSKDPEAIVAKAKESPIGQLPLQIVAKHPHPDESHKDDSGSKQEQSQVDSDTHVEGKQDQKAHASFAQIASNAKATRTTQKQGTLIVDAPFAEAFARGLQDDPVEDDATTLHSHLSDMVDANSNSNDEGLLPNSGPSATATASGHHRQRHTQSDTKTVTIPVPSPPSPSPHPSPTPLAS